MSEREIVAEMRRHLAEVQTAEEQVLNAVARLGVRATTAAVLSFLPDAKTGAAVLLRLHQERRVWKDGKLWRRGPRPGERQEDLSLSHPGPARSAQGDLFGGSS